MYSAITTNYLVFLVNLVTHAMTLKIILWISQPVSLSVSQSALSYIFTKNSFQKLMYLTLSCQTPYSMCFSPLLWIT